MCAVVGDGDLPEPSISSSSHSQAAPARISTAVAVLLHAEFFLTGIATTLLGPILPILSAQYSLSHAQVSWFFVAQFTTNAIGSLLSQKNYRVSLTLGAALIAAGIAALAFSPWPAALIPVAVYGFGLGLVLPATNMIVAFARPTARAASVNLLNVAWSTGAVVCPVLIATFQQRIGLRGALFLIAALGAILAALLLLAKLPPHAPGLDGPRAETNKAQAYTLEMALFCLMLFLYVGIENAIGGWTSSYTAETGGADVFGQAFAVLGFWLAILLGRLSAPLVLKLVRERVQYHAALCTALAGTITMMMVHSRLAVIVLVFVTGWGMAPLFALNISALAQYAEQNKHSVPGWLFALGGMGGAVLPWIVGQASTHFGSIRRGLIAPMLGLLLMWILMASRRELSSNPR